MIKDRIVPILEERASTNDEWQYGVEQCHKKLIKLLIEDMDKTVLFLINDCTADQFVWISEILEEIVEKTQRNDFIEALRKLALKYPNETKKYNITSFIDSAESLLN